MMWEGVPPSCIAVLMLIRWQQAVSEKNSVMIAICGDRCVQRYSTIAEPDPIRNNVRNIRQGGVLGHMTQVQRMAIGDRHPLSLKRSQRQCCGDRSLRMLLGGPSRPQIQARRNLLPWLPSDECSTSKRGREATDDFLAVDMCCTICQIVLCTMQLLTSL